MDWLARHKVGVWAFLVAVAYVPGIMSAAIVPRWAVVALGVPLVSQIRLQIPVVLQLAIAAGLAWSAASIIRAPDQLDSLLQLFLMCCLFGAMAVASQLETLDDALAGLCWGIGVSSAFCVATFLVGYPIIAQSHPSNFPGLFYNSEVLVELCAPLLVWAVIKHRWLLGGFVTVPILLNSSRISFVVVAVGLLTSYWPRTWRARVAIMGTVALGLVAIVSYITFGDPAHYKFGSAASRLVSWLTAVYSLTPAGHGFGWWRAVHGGEEFAHSDLLQAFVEIGIGALLFALIPLYALWNRRDHAERAAFIVICLEVGVSFPLHVPATGFLAALLAGYLVRERAGVRDIQPDGGGETGDRHGWHAAHAGSPYGGGRRGSLVVPIRSAAAVLPEVGGQRARPEAV